MKPRAAARRPICFLLLLLLSAMALQQATRRVRDAPRSGFLPAKLTSEGITIAVDPLCTDALARQVFDKKTF